MPKKAKVLTIAACVGKIVRRLLRQKTVGDPLGDLSTVANPGALDAE